MAPVAAVFGAVASMAGAIAPLAMQLMQPKPKTPSGSSNTSSLEAELAARNADQNSSQARIDARDAARKRQAAMAQGGTGRGDTILTSPLGEVGDSTGNQPTTLLGG